jgi:hypothetical protein
MPFRVQGLKDMAQKPEKNKKKHRFEAVLFLLSK